MYAVVKTGGKQYRVAEGDVVKVEKLDGEPGQSVEFDEVLLVNTGSNVVVGKPTIAGAKVAAEIVDQDRDRKILVFKYKRRKRYRRKSGHRQAFTALKITGISSPAAE
ncbi:MAG: 50S ribosomal protein L21 [Proteobacteria bacterium]|nr:MAG: 50S ribosomal protein L21 [Pseudomonadota bacterium]